MPGLPEPTTAPTLEAGVIDCAAYDGGVRVSGLDIDSIAPALGKPGQFVWIGLFEPEEELLRRVQQQFHLHDLAIEDAYNAHQRPKLEIYEDSLFLVLRTAHLAHPSSHIEFGETHVFVGPNYIVTVRHGSLRSHVGVRHRCEASPTLLRKGPGYVLYALMDFIVDQYLPVVQAIEEDVQEIEEGIFGDEPPENITPRIYRLKRELLALRRTVSPLIEVCNRLMRFDLPHIPEEIRPYFRDVHDHVLRLNETIDAQRELLTTALEAHLSLLSVAQNDHMKRLAAWAAMIGVPTMIAGIYGMNFRHMPELNWQWGYYLSLGGMAAASGGLYLGFKRSGWL